jgi:3-oxoacyl-[acyl-carrier protein] reductase
MNQENISVLPLPSELEKSQDRAGLAPVAAIDFDKIQPGDEVHFSKKLLAADVNAFAELSGDQNPLHMDEGFASRTHFQRRVVHGMLLANYVSALVGMRCPGPGALWSQQNFRWHAPVFIGDEVRLTLKVTHKSAGLRTMAIEVKAEKADGKVVMDGEGLVTALEERKQTAELPITERVAFVSGGSRGVGAAISSALALAGAAVVVNYRTQASSAEDLCAAIRSRGGRAIPLRGDVSNYSSIVEAMQEACQEFQHPVDLLVNNAGSLPELRPFLQTTWEEVQSALDIHVRGAFHCCQATIPGMIGQKSGRIINIGSSLLRTAPSANWTCFLLAKAAIQTMTKCLAAELGPHGIRVNTVSPGLIETDSLAVLPERTRKVQAMQTPLRRLASPEDIAAVVLALCTTAGDFITGAEIPVCGGSQM